MKARALANLTAPQPMARLAFIRILVPLAILGYLSLRMMHSADWLSVEGFSVPFRGQYDWRKPFHIDPLPVWAAWSVSAILLVSGLALSFGFLTRYSGGIFGAALIYVTLADRLASFTVNKLGVVLIVALCFTPCHQAWSLDARLSRKGKAVPTLATWGNVRFFQILLVLMYCMTGVAKWKGEWLSEPMLLWTHLHGSYQTGAGYLMARNLPMEIWPFLRWVVLAFELLAPLWFLMPWTRLPALYIGLGMHFFIGLMFGPVVWFALLMAVLLLGCFSPESWLTGILDAPRRTLRALVSRSRNKPVAEAGRYQG
jgi:hypothetical protein